MYESLMEQVVSRENATVAWEAVKRNRGAAGIDGMTTELCDAIRPCGRRMTAAFNRRMRKTARTVVWEGAGAKSPALDPIVTLLHEPE